MIVSLLKIDHGFILCRHALIDHRSLNFGQWSRDHDNDSMPFAGD